MKMNHELTAKWHELDKVRVGLKDVVVLRPDLSSIQRQIGDLSDLTTEAKENLVAAINEAAASGGSGSMDLRVADGYIQYSTDSGSTWTNLIAMADLKGADGITPHIGDNGNWYLGEEDTGKPSRGETGPQGVPGVYYGTTQPTGETHPVWIDPDGGPDDGGLLPAVTTADNGKVLRVVNSTWSAEDMPTGGTDMGITGATVGQIAKIAAVDASGVPTAWSPSDMPSGGSSDFVITGTVTGETLTTDKTYEQVQEAVQAGKRVTLKANVYGIDFVLSQIGESSIGYLFATTATIVPGLIAQFTAAVGEAGQNLFVNANVVSYDSDGNLMQVTMDSDPLQPMEIATKQYVDASGVPSVTADDNGKFLRVVNGAWVAAAINDANGVSF